jgi:hypothetical protein
VALVAATRADASKTARLILPGPPTTKTSPYLHPLWIGSAAIAPAERTSTRRRESSL